MEGDSANKSSRVLELYHELMTGKVVNKAEAAKKYGVATRSIKRDIESIRDFLSEQTVSSGILQTVEYDPTEKGFKLVKLDINYLTNGEMLAICKILLSSRSMPKEQISSLLGRLLQLCVSPKDKMAVEYHFANELFNYLSPAHPAPDTNLIWQTAEAIRTSHFVEITYRRLKKPESVTRTVEPVGIVFSEYYFYLLGVLSDEEDRKGFRKQDDAFPTIYRLDRISSMRTLDDRFSIPYAERFEEGKYKNANQFMFGGEPHRVVFQYSGPSPEAVLDRLPTAEVRSEKEGVYTISAEVFGDGILMWLLSQGDKVRVISPQQLRNEWLDTARNILKRGGEMR